MFFHDENKHHSKHIHVEYAGYDATFDLQGNILTGEIPRKQKKLVEAWIIIHREELEALWKSINEDGEYFKIAPLR